MADMLQAGSDWLEQMRHAHATQAVIYRRGADSVACKATLARTQYEVEDDYGLRIRVEVADFLILADDLVLNDQKVEPEVGDRIETERAGTAQAFEVLSLAGEGPWRFSDVYGKTLRIHTKQV